MFPKKANVAARPDPRGPGCELRESSAPRSICPRLLFEARILEKPYGTAAGVPAFWVGNEGFDAIEIGPASIMAPQQRQMPLSGGDIIKAEKSR
jgi:hypothetical protein